MKFKFLIIFLITLIFSSCASYNYKGYLSEYNHTVIIESDNLNNYTIFPVGNSTLLAHPTKTEFALTLPNLKKTNRRLLLYHPNYDSIFLTVKKAPRKDALIKDIGLSLVTFGLPIIIDVFNKDFYSVSPKTKNFYVHFEFSQNYMASEFARIRFSNNLAYFQDWIHNYPSSVFFDSAITIKDSIELSIAIGKEKAVEIDDFIRTHPNSKYLIRAKEIKKEIIEAKALFDAVRIQNTVAGYENYLKKYPKSLQNREAHRNLLNLAEKEGLNSHNMITILKYFNSYLRPNLNFINLIELEEKCLALTMAIDNQLIADNIAKNSVSKYDSYSKLWIAYNDIKKTIPKEYLRVFSITESYKKQIFSLLFPQLKTNTSKTQQTEFIKKINTDFPNIENSGDESKLIINIIDCSITKSGILKIWDVGYLPYLFQSKQIVYGNLLLGREGYFYDGNYHGSLTDGEVNYEEIAFSNGNLLGLTKCFIGNQMVFSLDIGKDGPKEISYFQNGELAKKTYFQSAEFDFNSYDYEFINGENVTLRDFQKSIDKAILLAENGDFETAIYILESRRNNSFPKTSQININNEKALASAIAKRDNYLNQLEKQRLAEEKRQRDIKLAEEREWQKRWEIIKKNSNNGSNPKWNPLDNNPGSKCQLCDRKIQGTGFDLWNNNDPSKPDIRKNDGIFGVGKFCTWEHAYNWWLTH